ncbi:MAG TPA: biotin--[acetyl-CoA-carboxylase] ligase [Gemmatimonadales bacterium]|nr:biotin--[acetyl-CoA-carboxylase] ligase [Gemmatimonadales bacterium]
MAGVTLDGIPAAALARRWAIPRCELVASLGSALDRAHALGAEGAPAGTVVLALEQTAGRGRDGRTWHSPPGGLWLALLLRPRAAPLGIMSIRAGLVLADVVDELAGRPIARLKWPNDVLVDDRKLAGVLCEGRWQGETPQWLAVGLGVNVANEIPAAVRDFAIALAEVIPGVRRIDVLDRLVPPLTRLGAATEQLTDQECRAFAARDWLRDRALRSPVAGHARGVRPDGALLVEGEGDVAVVREGHVETA